ncbi:hypothetical protein Sm713_07370 [Streptomyces sp. TS71-3]|nr:hypothetical protein Sm713_07370 [Streptomyces sp. TS71-3]
MDHDGVGTVRGGAAALVVGVVALGDGFDGQRDGGHGFTPWGAVDGALVFFNCLARVKDTSPAAHGVGQIVKAVWWCHPASVYWPTGP